MIFTRITRMPLLLVILGLGIVKMPLSGLAQISQDPESHLLFLKNDQIEFGVMPELAGSVLVLRRPGRENMILSHPEDWSELPAEIPSPRDVSTWKDYLGHIIWLGPQSDFWNQQDVLPELHGRVWPPDPYLVYGHYQVIKQSDRELKLLGPSSAYTGVQLSKHYVLKENRIEMEVVATNTTDHALNWDIWSNTRVNGDQPFLVPVDSEDDIRIQSKDEQRMPWIHKDGYFTFLLDHKTQDISLNAKAFISVSAPWIASFTSDTVFVKSFDRIEPSLIHPEQGAVEVYYRKKSKDRDALIELEAHGAYTTLQPGESMSFKEVWVLYPYDSDNSLIARIAWVRSHLGCVR